MIDHVVSKSCYLIRLTAERWTHITEEHCELAGLRAEVLETVLRPERILLGGDEELIALRALEQGKHLVVVYRERAGDGFIITAFVTRRARSLSKRRQVWP
jgi:CMP-2-keto-3-deoxyoctulosonic acid synthetase